MSTPAVGVALESDFPSTQWSVVLKAGAADSVGRDAMAQLARQYWYPLYAYSRRKMTARHAAEDIIQEFFVYLLDNGVIGKANRSAGQFRVFLLTCFSRFRVSEYRKGKAAKRGGNRVHFALDFESADRRFESEAMLGGDPEDMFRYAWAMEILRRTTDILRSKYAAKGKLELFELLSRKIGEDDAKYSEIATVVGLTGDAVRTAARTLRDRFEREIRKVIGQTVGSPAEIEGEIIELQAALSRRHNRH